MTEVGASMDAGLPDHDEELLASLRSALSAGPRALVGSYEILSVTARGGQGTIYRARQRSTGRIVALKRVHPGLSEEEAWRFTREIEVELSLHHPHIVSVFGVEAEAGELLLVLEWIDGVHLDRWAHPAGPSAPGRPVREVQKLMLGVCDALAHAHERGVVHRDLKPSNILVDAHGVAHVLDFGLAKLLDPRDAAQSSRSGSFLGTLGYAAPEQLLGLGIDARTDVHALGCLLHECLTGQPPFDVTQGLDAATRAICHQDPALASRSNPGVDADLDAIVSKALAKEPARRYASVEALAADLRRHLAGEPVEARRASVLHVVRRLARRHRSLAAGVVIGFCCLALGTVAAAWQAHEAALRARDADAVSEVLLDLLREADPFRSGKRRADPELLDSIADLTPRLAGMPAHRSAPIHLEFGRISAAHNRLPLAEEHLRRAHELYGRGSRAGALGAAAAAHELSIVLHATGRLEAARVLIDQALEVRVRELRPDAQEALVSLCRRGLLLHGLGHLAEGEREIRRAVEGLSDSAKGHADLIFATNMLSFVVASGGRFAEALETSSRAARWARDSLEPDHPLLLGVLTNQAYQLLELNRVDEAEALIGEVMARYGSVLPADHRAVTSALEVQTFVHIARGRLADAERGLRQVLHLRRSVQGPPTLRTLITTWSLGTLLLWSERRAEAMALLREAYEGIDLLPGERPVWRLRFRRRLALTLADSSLEGAREALALLATPGPQAQVEELPILLQHARLVALRSLGRAAECVVEAKRVLESDVPQHPVSDDLPIPLLMRALAQGVLGGAHLDLGEVELARGELLEAAKACDELLRARHPERALYFPEVRALWRDLVALARIQEDDVLAAAWQSRLETPEGPRD